AYPIDFEKQICNNNIKSLEIYLVYNQSIYIKNNHREYIKYYSFYKKININYDASLFCTNRDCYILNINNNSLMRFDLNDQFETIINFSKVDASPHFIVYNNKLILLSNNKIILIENNKIIEQPSCLKKSDIIRCSYFNNNNYILIEHNCYHVVVEKSNIQLILQNHIKNKIMTYYNNIFINCSTKCICGDICNEQLIIISLDTINIYN